MATDGLSAATRAQRRTRQLGPVWKVAVLHSGGETARDLAADVARQLDDSGSMSKHPRPTAVRRSTTWSSPAARSPGRASDSPSPARRLGCTLDAHSSTADLVEMLQRASVTEDPVLDLWTPTVQETFAIGDTDTIAAMTGALAGASLGLGAIPEAWLQRVEGIALLREFADRLVALRWT